MAHIHAGGSSNPSSVPPLPQKSIRQPGTPADTAVRVHTHPHTTAGPARDPCLPLLLRHYSPSVPPVTVTVTSAFRAPLPQKFIRQPGMPADTAVRVYRRYLKLEPAHAEEYIAHLKVGRATEGGSGWGDTRCWGLT
jgi:hypothetical protein